MRYPTRGGLAVPPQELGFTVPTEEQLARPKLVTIHHNQWERSWYAIERYRSVFRNLVVNTYPMLANEHTSGLRALHGLFEPPKRPKDALMIEVVEDYLCAHGVIHCIKEKHTRDVYEINQASWDAIKRGYRSGTSK